MKPVLIASLSAALFSSGAAMAESITVVDDVGREVEIELPVERAIVLNSYSHELLRAIGVDDRIVGQDQVAVDRLPYIHENADGVIIQNQTADANYEAIIALQPDVFIAPRNSIWEEAEAALEPFDIPVVVLTAWDTTRFHFNVDLASQIFEEEEGAAELAAFYDGIIDLLAERTAGIDPLSIYLEDGTAPFETAVPGSGYHDLILSAGAENLFGDIVFGEAGHTEGSVHNTPISPEDLIRRNPDLIIYEIPTAYGGNDAEAFAGIGQDLLGRPGWAGLSAVTSGKVYVVNGFALSALSKQLGALYAATWLYPDLFADVDPDEYLRRWIEDFQRADYDGPEDYVFHVTANL